MYYVEVNIFLGHLSVAVAYGPLG